MEKYSFFSCFIAIRLSPRAIDSNLTEISFDDYSNFINEMQDDLHNSILQNHKVLKSFLKHLQDSKGNDPNFSKKIIGKKHICFAQLLKHFH
jgi:hypothetical protein